MNKTFFESNFSCEKSGHSNILGFSPSHYSLTKINRIVLNFVILLLIHPTNKCANYTRKDSNSPKSILLLYTCKYIMYFPRQQNYLHGSQML